MTQMTLPKMKACIIMGTSVKGMQKTASSRSLTAKFSRYILVMVRIFLCLTSVRITRQFPTTDRRKMTAYGMDRKADILLESFTWLMHADTNCSRVALGNTRRAMVLAFEIL